MASKDKGSKPVFIKKRDILILAVLLLLAGGVWLFTRFNSQPGAVARVNIGYSSNQQAMDIPLNKDTIYTLEQGNLPVQLEVEDGRIRFINSVCPDHDCEGFGWLSHEGDWAACLPAAVTIRVFEAD